MLDERRAAILRAVVEGYIETAQPVGSGHVARREGIGVSPATIRNDMVVLEQEGYLSQPHTSAGRIPTDKGYRFFVDSLVGPGDLDAVRRQQVRAFFNTTHGAIEDMLHQTSQLLSNLTDYAANPAFRLKMLLLVLALANMLAFHAGAWRSSAHWGEGGAAPLAARVAGGLSLGVWIGVICAGRWIAFAG